MKGLLTILGGYILVFIGILVLIYMAAWLQANF